MKDVVKNTFLLDEKETIAEKNLSKMDKEWFLLARKSVVQLQE